MLLGIDFDGTIADTRISVGTSLLWVASQDSQEAVRRLDSCRHLIEGKTLEVQLKSFISSLDFDSAWSLYMSYYKSEGLQWTKLNSGAKELLSYCREHGIGVVVISAKSDINLSLSMTHLGLQGISYFGGCNMSEKSYLLESLGVDLYVGDQESDIAAARNANVKVALLDSEKPEIKFGLQPDYRIQCLTDVTLILQTFIKSRSDSNNPFQPY